MNQISNLRGVSLKQTLGTVLAVDSSIWDSSLLVICILEILQGYLNEAARPKPREGRKEEFSTSTRLEVREQGLL